MSFNISKLPEPYAEQLDNIFGIKDCLVEVNPGKCLLPMSYSLLGQKIFDLKIRPDDVFLVSYPRTGSTWCLELLWLLKNNLDFDGAKKKMLQQRAQFLELSVLFYDFQDAFHFLDGYDDSVDAIDDLPSPRVLRTHLPLDLLPAEIKTVKPKMLYVTRSPKDMIISLYHYCRLFHDITAPLDDFCELFLLGKVPYGAMFDHIQKYWNIRDDPNVLFITYEEMTRDMEASIEKIATFLEVEVTKEQKDLLMEHLSFKNMKQNEACNLKFFVEYKKGKEFCRKSDESLIRKGEVGDWQNHMSEELSKKFDTFIEENTRELGLSFLAPNSDVF